MRQAVKEGLTTSSIAASAAPPPVPASLKQKIDAEVGSAQQVSRDFNHAVVAVRHEQALATLATTVPQSVPIEAQEREPNDDALATNEIKLGTWITASIGSGNDADYFAFTRRRRTAIGCASSCRTAHHARAAARAVRCGEDEPRLGL